MPWLVVSTQDLYREKQMSGKGETGFHNRSSHDLADPVQVWEKTHRPLLEEHYHCCHDDPTEHRHRLEKRRDRNKLQLHSVPGGRLRQVWEVCCDRPLLEDRLCLDLKKFELDQLVVDRHVAELSQSSSSFLLSVVVDEPTGRERHEDHSNKQYQSREELKSQRHQPGCIRLCIACAADVIGAVVLDWLVTDLGMQDKCLQSRRIS